MEFRIERLEQDFQFAVDWIINGKHNYQIRRTLGEYLVAKANLQNEADPKDAFELIIRTKITHSFSRQAPLQFEHALNTFFAEHSQSFRTPAASRELTSIIEKFSVFPRDRQDAANWVRTLLGKHKSLRTFTADLYGLRKTGGKSRIMGPKGSDHYLRNVGYWDIIPIDIHERRFILRTGIFHALAVTPNQDPTDELSLQNALARFSSALGIQCVNNISLANAPGIVDLLIWYFCADGKYEICGMNPRCEKCVMATSCLYALVHKASIAPMLQTPSISESSATTHVASGNGPTEAAIRSIKRKLADQYIQDWQEARLFLMTGDKDIHDWGTYIAALILSKQNKQVWFGRKDIIMVLRQLIPDIFDKKYAKGSRVLPADVCTKTPQSSQGFAFPCLEACRTGKMYRYRFLGLQEGIKAKFGDKKLQEMLSRST